jgi:hypothetical protein
MLGNSKGKLHIDEQDFSISNFGCIGHTIDISDHLALDNGLLNPFKQVIRK